MIGIGIAVVGYCYSPSCSLTKSKTEGYTSYLVACLPVGLRLESQVEDGERPQRPYSESDTEINDKWQITYRTGTGYMTDFPSALLNKRCLGFHFVADRYTDIGQTAWGSFNVKRTYRSITFPYWFVIATPASLLMLQLRRKLVLRLRRRRGRCERCGYDLRASVEKCPECGASITPPRV
jgi:hypothetical protein